jgi:N-acetyl-anhydromuramyl-L-alanine amidase AmpD
MKVLLQLLQVLALRWTMQQRRVVDHHDVAADSASGRLRWIHYGSSGQKRSR